MSTLRFNQIWIALLLLSILGAFVIPQHYSDRVRNVQAVFAPVAWPTQKIAAVVQRRFGKPVHDDPRAPADIVTENRWLKTQLVGLQGQLEELKRRNADRDLLGDLRPFCTPVSVMGVSTDARDALILPATLEGLAEGQPVLYPGGLIGKVQRAGAGAQVRLITDVGFTITGWCIHFARDQAGTITTTRRDTPLLLMRGVGKGELKILALARKECEKLAEGDFVVLDDPAWPKSLRYQRIGQVAGFEDLPGSPLQVNVKIKPESDLVGLREVMVMTKDGH